MLPQNPLSLTQCEAKTWMLSIVREAWSTKTTIKQPWSERFHRFLEVAKRNKWIEGSYSSSGRWKRRKTLMKKTVKSIKFNTKFCFTCTFSKKQDQPKLFSFFIFDTNVFINDLSLKTEHKAKKEKKKKTQKRKKSGTNSNCIRVS
jgi:hypothetical protein